MESSESGHNPPSLQPFELAGIHVDPGLNEITRGGNSVRIEPRVMQLMLHLVEHLGRTCTREDIMASVWSDSLPNEEALTQSVSKLRKALGDGDRSLLETIRKVGYRLNGRISRIAPPRQLGKDRTTSKTRSPRDPSSKRWVLALAAMLLVAFAISRFKVIAIHHEGREGPRMVKIQLSKENGVMQAGHIRLENDSTLVEALTWIEKGDETTAFMIE
jgi:DNA-binding winged helix-turn-helix (wHTH) protein